MATCRSLYHHEDEGSRQLAVRTKEGLLARGSSVIRYRVNACGLRLAPEAEGGSAAHQAAGSSALPDALEPGRIVFVYRRAHVDHVAAPIPRHLAA
jgi:hypothetical protein